MGFLFYFPSAKIDAFPQAECREHLALEISLPKLLYCYFFIPPVGCLGLMSQFLALPCQFCLHMPVPKVPSRGPGGVSWCQGEELESHSAQCPLQVSLAAPGQGPLPSFLLLGGSQIFLIPLRWCWQGQFGQGFMQGLAVISVKLYLFISVPK